MTETPRPFDLRGPLPAVGTHVLEASAGTGKTFTIAALAARYIAAGVPLSALLMVTFSRAATQELRDRIRERLTGTEAALIETLAGAAGPDDPVDHLLCTGSPADLNERRYRIAAALADFDAATIATTHEFCGRMLDGLGALAGVNPSATHVENVKELSREVAADRWLQDFARETRPDFPWDDAVAIAEQVAEFDGPLAPGPQELPAFASRIEFAERIRREVTERKADQGLVTYTDLLTRLRDLLQGRHSPDAPPDPVLAATARARLRARFPVVLVDEFQDTDPVQWQILSDAFAGHSTLVLIGDPKQAIYSFRGAEVNAYLAAVSTPGAHHYTLNTNYRTDSPLVEALQGLFGGAALGDPRIPVRQVVADHVDCRLHNSDGTPASPLRLRIIPPRDSPRQATAFQYRPIILADLVADIGHRLSDGTTIDPGGGRRAVGPRDIAVLVRSNWVAEEIRAALAAAGIPAVYAGATSVFETAEAADWLTLLRACADPRSETIRRVALTCFFEWSLEDLVIADEAALGELSAHVRSWRQTLVMHGVAALVEAILGTGVAVRLLAQPNGDRRITDFRHVGQALHAVQTRDRLGPTALVDWLNAQRAEASADAEDRTRRLETDADAVQVMTVWRAKGLEFPIVYLPDQWETRRGNDNGEPFAYHRNGERHLYLVSDPRSPHRQRIWREYQEEQAGEALRLLYVAATRAQCQLVVWWAAGKNSTERSSLHRLLFRGGAATPGLTYPITTSPADLLQPPGLVVEQVGQLVPPVPEVFAQVVPELQVRAFDRPVDTGWRRTSYSGLTARAHDAAHPGTVVPEGHEDDEISKLPDEGDLGEPAPHVPLGGDLTQPSPMALLPRGPAFGTLVHAIYETFDPHAADLRAEVIEHAGRWLDRLPTGTGFDGDTLTAESLADALLPALDTPLGPIADGRCLRDIAPADRLAELDFEYPLVGGDRPTGSVLLAGMADLLEEHLLPTDPLVAYPERLRDPLLAEEVLRGYLVGSIDAVLRIPGPAGNRYLVVDYKTNWLGPMDDATPLLVGHYTPAAMTAAMMDAHYPLQALLYGVALHRFLRWRLPGYDPELHLGGAAYLFVRGMTGRATPTVDGTPCGVFSWHPPAALITALSDWLAGTEETP